MDLTSGEISKHIKEIAIPASLGFFFNTMFNFVDTYFAGWISTEALASLSISFPIFFIIIAVVQGVSTGSSALISNALGEKNHHEIEKISAQILSFALLAYLILMPLGLYFSRPLFGLLGATGNYLTMATSYMDIIFIGSFFLILLYAANSILLAHGNSRILRNFLIAGFFLNAILNPWFLFGGFGIPAMGIRGIATATVVTMILGFIYVLYEVTKRGYLKPTSIREFIPQKKAFLEITKQSLPATLNMMTIGIGIFIITLFVKNFGQAAVAALGIGIRIEQATLLPTIGLTVAALSITGQNNGAKLYSRIEQTIKISLKYGILIVLVGSTLMLSFPEFFYRIFTDDPKVIEIGTSYLRIAALTSLSYVILGINIAVLQGMKKPFYALFIGSFRQFIAPIIVFYVLINCFRAGLNSIWWSIFAITWIAALITVYYTCKTLKNTKINV